MKKSIIKIIFFVSIFIVVMIYFMKIYSFKHLDGAYVLETFYAQEEDINDVIFIGSSNVFENVNTGILWEEYGIASYDLAASSQSLWNSYYYIKEALKTQTPQLIVLDLYGAQYTADYAETSKSIKSTFGINLSKDKIEAIKNSVEKENWRNYFWEFPMYHTRYKELEMADFLPNLGSTDLDSWKGYSMNPMTIEYDRPEGFETDEVIELTKKSEEYLRKICKLCIDRNVKLQLIKAPNITNIENTMRYNGAAKVAEEYGVPYINFNYYYDEIGLDFSTDMADYAHLNYKGNVKFTRYLAEFLKENYNIPDRRGEIGYESYEKNALMCKAQTENAYVYDAYEIDEFLDKIQKENYLVIYSICGDFKKASNFMEIKEEFVKYGICLDERETSSVWVIQNGEMLYNESNTCNNLWYKELAPYKTIEISAQGTVYDSHSIIYNREKMDKVNSGINIVVYDTITQTIVDAVAFPIVNNRIEITKIR